MTVTGSSRLGQFRGPAARVVDLVDPLTDRA